MGITNLRLIPVVAIAAAALFVLKASGLVLDRGYALISSRTAQAQGVSIPPVLALDPDTQTPAPAAAPAPDEAPAPRGDRSPSRPQDNFGYSDYTGSVAAKPAPAAEPQAPPPTMDLAKPAMTAGERAVLESLVQRRQKLEARAREIDVRENLLKAAEQRIEARLQELKEAEARLTGAASKRDDAESAKFKNLVTMYENMKAKEAAKVFDRLDLRILVDVVNLMNPRRMSDILAQMSPEVAEKLTIEIANRSGPGRPAPATELPKIEGKPNKT